MLKSMGADDWTMLAAQTFYTAYLACQIGGVVHGTGRHIEDLSTSDAQTALRVNSRLLPVKRRRQR